MITVERTVRVQRPVAAVFTYLADFTHTEAWDPNTVSTTRSDAGPLHVGSTFRNVSTYRGRQTELTYTLARMDTDTHLTFNGTNKTVDSTDDMAMRSADGGTEITYRAHFRFKGLARLAEPVLRSGFETIADDTVRQLLQTLETQLPADG